MQIYMGRPKSYKPEYAEQAVKLTKLGATDKQLADFFKVAESTVNKWKLDYPEFSESLKKGKKVADNEVEKSLFKRATGYSHPETHISNYQGKITLTELVKHYPPDTTACIFWLKNRDPKNWRDKPGLDEHEEATPMSITFEVKEAVSDIQVTNAKF